MEPEDKITITEMNEKLGEHFQDDLNFQQEFRDFQQEFRAFQQEIRDSHKRMEPMVQAFENKKVVKMAFQAETKTIVFYLQQISIISGFLVSAWVIIKYIIIRFLVR